MKRRDSFYGIGHLAGSRALALASLFLAASCQRARADDPSPSPTDEPQSASAPTLRGQRVEVAKLSTSVQALSIEVPAEVEGHRDALLATALGGYVEAVHVREGDRVRKGQLLASVDGEMHELRLARARIELESATRELERAEALSGSIPVAEADAARDRKSSAHAALRELQLNSARAKLRAPFSGVVARLDTEVGEVAPPGAPLLRLVQIQPALVTLTLSDRDRALARVGARASVQLEARSGIFEGTVKRLASVADPETRAFEAAVEVDNADGQLLPGMIARVVLDTGVATAGSGPAAGEGEPETLVISQDWLVTRPGAVGVFLEETGRARWRPVELGGILRKQVVVESGLAPGDTIVITGHRDLQDGDELLVHRRGTCCEQGRAVFR